MSMTVHFTGCRMCGKPAASPAVNARGEPCPCRCHPSAPENPPSPRCPKCGVGVDEDFGVHSGGLCGSCLADSGFVAHILDHRENT